MAIVKTPVEGYTGSIGADLFVGGVCTDVPDDRLEYYRRQGYIILDQETTTPLEAPIQLPADSAPKADWVTAAVQLGIDVKNKTKAEIIAAVTAATPPAEE
ncbi:MAG: hypothetical protein ACFNXY_01635 [Corynebacterium matruchotii]|uniref:hypothetical protein n=1 Tax=Corynebacterium matruchotii TaxID=43768 RepID=UPI00360F7987